MGVGRSRQDTEVLEDLQFDPVIGHDVGLGPVPGGIDLAPVRTGRRGHPDRLTLQLPGIVEDVAQHGEAVLGADAQSGHQGEVVDAGHGGVDGAHVDVEDEAEPELQAHELVAQTDGPHRGAGADGAAQCGQGIAHVQKRRLRRVALDGGGDTENDGDGTKRPGDAAGADGVPHRLPDPVAGGDLEIIGHAGESADG